MVKKVIVITTDWAPFSDKVIKICEEEVKRVGADFEIRKDDWVFLTRYGELDELGGADVPQVFVEDDGRVKHVLTKVPIDAAGRPDFEEARRRVASALQM